MKIDFCCSDGYLRLATMEQYNGETEESEFSQIPESRQTEPQHNITEGGSEVAWLNAARGRELGPNTAFEVYKGDSLDLSVHAKYERKNKRARAGSLLPSGSGLPIPSDYGGMALTGGLNPLLLYNLAEILAFDLSTEPEPEAYMGYARYNADSTSMRKGFRVFSNSKLEG